MFFFCFRIGLSSLVNSCFWTEAQIVVTKGWFLRPIWKLYLETLLVPYWYFSRTSFPKVETAWLWQGGWAPCPCCFYARRFCSTHLRTRDRILSSLEVGRLYIPAWIPWWIPGHLHLRTSGIKNTWFTSLNQISK